MDIGGKTEERDEMMRWGKERKRGRRGHDIDAKENVSLGVFVWWGFPALPPVVIPLINEKSCY